MGDKRGAAFFGGCAIACLIAVSTASCVDGAEFAPPCNAKTARHLAEASDPKSGCDDVIVLATELESLDGFSDPDGRMELLLADNSKLSDISAASGVRSLQLEYGHPGLNDIDLRVQRTAFLHDATLDSVVLRMPQTAKSVSIAGRIRDFTLWCDAPCTPDLDISGDKYRTTDALRLVNATINNLRVDLAFDDWEFLMPLGVPQSVELRSRDVDNAAAVQAYRDWLATKGFAGEFVHCTEVDDIETCEGLAASES